MSVPGLDFLMIYILTDELNIIIRISLILLFCVACFVFLCLSYTMSLIPTSAVRPYQALNSIIARKSLDIKLKLKVCQLIEKLSGPVIGLYCYEFFPFTNYEVYLYVTNCVMNFILFMDLL